MTVENPDFDLKQFLPYLLNQAAEAASLEFAQVYKDRYGLLRTDWRVLFHLGLFERMTAQDISASASIHKTKVSRAVQRLEDRRYLQREKDSTDRRREHLSLTPLGKRVYADLHEVARQYDARLTQGMTAQELSVLRGALMTLAGGG